MNNREFDRIVKEKIEREKISMPPGNGFDDIADRLPVARKKMTPLFLKIAAAVLLLIGLGFGGMILLRQNKQQTGIVSDKSPAVKQKKPGIISARVLPDDANNSKIAAHSSESSKKAISKSVVKNNIVAQKQSVSSALFVDNNGKKVQKRSEKQISKKITLPKSQRNAFSTTDNQGTKKLRYADFNLRTQKMLSPAPSANNAFIERYGFRQTGSRQTSLHEKADEHAQNTLLSVGGGMHYGSLNAGYGLALSARHDLGKHFFVAGNVSVLMNNSVNKTGTYANASTLPSRPSGFTGDPSGNSITRPVNEFYYLQINPSFGYQINDFMALSFGPDVQQRISRLGEDGTTIITPGTNPRIIPDFDLGITGKTEFSISPKIEAGILFREGLNNLLKRPDVHPYLNRRYIQLQLNYNFVLR